MRDKEVKRLSTSDVKARFRQIVQEVATTGTPVIVQTRGEDQAVIVSLDDFRALWPEARMTPEEVRDRVRAALRAAGLLSEPTPQEVAVVQAFETKHAPTGQERMLAMWRQLKLTPTLSEIILQNREREFD